MTAIAPTSSQLKAIQSAVEKNQPLSREQGLYLYQECPTEALQTLAHQRKLAFHGDKVFYNQNVHFEPTNLCVYSCKFCSFYRSPKAKNDPEAWDHSLQDAERFLKRFDNVPLTEVHITGGVHPDRELSFWCDLIRLFKRLRPGIHIKAYTAVEIAFMARKAEKSVREVLEILKEAGLDSLPGGGAEIFNQEVRRKIAGGKAPSHRWLEIHQVAHEIGLCSNATMLYGHVESFADRIDHMLLLRELQERTGGFNSFIPLKYRNENNALSEMQELPVEEDLRNYAVSRLMLHNIRHLKAYWVMSGGQIAEKSLMYGVDDLDGTVYDTTKIYSMAGSIEHPTLTKDQLHGMIRKHGFVPVERDSIYREIVA